ncbi:MAG: hypothetical protein ACYS1C_08720 [Planctomycetota bacterium]|jgi:hypothetical protein
MLARVDIIGKIEQLYMDGRLVPYLTFMQVFNELLADPRNITPKPPSDELKEAFRAVCMCVNVGIVDTEGRQEEREQEFREKVYPVWKAALPAEEFAGYEDIIQGGLRERRRLQAQREAEAAERQAEERSRELLDRLGLAELEQEAAPAAPPPAELPSRAALGRFDDVDALCNAIRAGKIRVAYRPRSEEKAFASYALGQLDVSVKLVDAEGSHYTVLKAGMGYSDSLGSPESMDLFAAEMGYIRMGDYAYMRRDDELVYTLKVGPSAVNAACTSAEAGAEEDVIRRVERLHRDLGELVERMR